MLWYATACTTAISHAPRPTRTLGTRRNEPNGLVKASIKSARMGVCSVFTPAADRRRGGARSRLAGDSLGLRPVRTEDPPEGGSDFQDSDKLLPFGHFGQRPILSERGSRSRAGFFGAADTSVG